MKNFYKRSRFILFIILFSLAPAHASSKQPINPAQGVSSQKSNWNVNIIRKETPGPLKVFVLDVGQGDSIFIEFPYGETVLVDAGSWDRYGIPHIKKFLEDYFKEHAYKNKTIDVVIATHPDYDHIKGMKDILTSYRVTWYIDNGLPVTSRLYSSLMKAVGKYDRENKTDYIAVKEDNPEFKESGFYHFNNIVHFKGADAYILGSYKGEGKQDVNNASVVMKIVYGKTSILLTGDSEGKNTIDKDEYIKTNTDDYEENRIYKRLKDRDELDMLRSDVLKVGHHGSHHSATEVYLSEVKPKISVISVGDYKISSHAERFGHPRLETLERLEKYTAEKASKHIIKAYSDEKSWVDFTTSKSILTTATRHVLKGKSIVKYGDIILLSDGSRVFLEETK